MNDIERYLQTLENKKRQADALTLLPLMTEASGYQASLNGTIIGFGKYHYKYDSGHQGDCFVTGFSPRKAQLVVYIMQGFAKYPTLMAKLGTYKTGKSCLYIKKLEDIDLDVLKQLINESVKDMQKMYHCTA